jgi:hypothetical protein
LTRTDDPEPARRAADLVYEADNTSARVAVEDARRVLHRFGDKMDNQGLRRSAESHLDVAERALDRAERARSRSGDGRRYFGSRAQAITQLRTAHRHAHMVMDFVGRSASPTVTIEGREDPARNGSERTQYVVSGNLSAPSLETVEAIEVTVNGDRTVRAVSSINRTGPGRNASYQAAVNLTERVNVIDVRVLGSGDSSDPTATATLRLDGDGLTDRQETTLFETDPLDPDSDAAVTASDESDDGVIDAREDFDGDNLTTTAEFDLGTDPLAADTDGDGLTDGAERRFTGTDPLAADSDSDGTSDADEDPDGDGLTHAEEVEAGTDPTAADVDGDGLTDPAELEAGTDPFKYDTDDDNLRDGRELEAPFNTDPLDEDTDDDGVLDGNETYTTTRRNATLNVSVEVRGEGDVAGGVTIDRPSHVRFREYAPENVSASRFVRLESTDSFDSATVTIGYNESRISSNESSLAIYTFNESAGHYDRLASTVNPANDTVTAQTSHFSVFAVFDEAAWETYIQSRQLRVQEIQDQMSDRSPPGGASEIAYVRMYRPDDSYYNSHSIRRFTADGEILWNRTTADLLGQTSAFFDDLELDPTGDLWVGGSGGDYGFVVQVSDDGAFLSQSSIIYLVESEFASNGNLFHISGASLVAITDAGRYDEAANGSIPSSHPVEAIETNEDGLLYVQSGSQYRAGGYTYLPLNSSITAFDTTIDSASGSLPVQWQISRNGRNSTGYGLIATGPNGDLLTVHSNNVGQVAKTFYLERRSAADGSVVWNHTIGSVSTATAQNHSGSLVDVGVSDEAIFVSVAEEITSLSPGGTERWKTSNPAFNASSVGGTGAEGSGPILGVGEEHVYVRRDIAGSHLSEFGGIAFLDPDTGSQTDVLFSSSTPPGSRSNPETEPISEPPSEEPRSQLGPRIFGEVVVDPDAGSVSGPDVPLADSDGDTIPDRFERQGIPLGRTGQTVQLDPYDPDTDGDGLNDSEEVNLRNIVTQPAQGERNEIGFEWSTHPLVSDTDGDGLLDGEERRGWTIPVVNQSSGGGPHRYDRNASGVVPGRASAHQGDSIYVRSNPLIPDSDHDGLTDEEEILDTHTDPRKDQTYEITSEHEQLLQRTFTGESPFEEMVQLDRLGLDRDDLDIEPYDPHLTDATDDFDLRTNPARSGLETYNIGIIDGRERTDYWLSNEHEITDSGNAPPFSLSEYYDVETNPWVADTDGDGLTDGQEFDGLEIRADGSRFHYSTDPTRRDTDEDRLDDLAELQFGSDPLDENVDEDQFSDFRDPNPRTESIPPEPFISYKDGVLGGTLVNVGATDSNGVDRLIAIYEYRTAAGHMDTVRYVEHGGGDQRVETVASPPGRVAKLTLTAIDTAGNRYSVEMQVGDDGTGQAIEGDIALAGLPAWGSLTGSSAVSLSGVSAVAGFGVGTAAVGGGLFAKHVYDVYTTPRTTNTYEVPVYPTPTVAEYRSGDIVLNEGFVETAAGHVRGYGWAYISATTDITQRDIEYVLRNGNEVAEGEVTYVIGDGLTEEDIVITIIGGAVLAAQDLDRGVQHDEAESNCEGENFAVETENDRGKEGNPEHTLRDEKPINDIDRLDEMIKNPDRILDFGNRRYLIRSLDDGVAVIKLHKNLGSDAIFELITQLTDKGDLYDSISDAVDSIKDDEEDGKEPTNDVRC